MSKIKLSSRDAILEAAFQTFSKRPGASLGDVAKHAGVGRATLHRHFSSRDVLMVALAHAAMQELNEAVNAATADAVSYTAGLKRALIAIIPLADRQWFLAHEPVEQDPGVAEAYKKDREELYSDIEAAKGEGTFDSNVPTRWIAETYENLIYGAWTLVREQELTAVQAGELAWRTLARGVGADRQGDTK